MMHITKKVYMSVGHDTYYKENNTCRWDMIHITKKVYMSVGHGTQYKENNTC